MAFASSEEATAANGAGQLFASQKELLRLASDWPAERLVEIWNGLPGVEAVTKFRSTKAGVGRIWERIQGLAEPAKPKAAKAKGGEKAAKKAPAGAKTGKKATESKNAPKARKGAKEAAKPKTTREGGGKKAEVIEMMRRKGGCTLAEITKLTGWQKHTIRGFVSILGSKGGVKVESTKNDAGERTYSIPR